MSKITTGVAYFDKKALEETMKQKEPWAKRMHNNEFIASIAFWCFMMGLGIGGIICLILANIEDDMGQRQEYEAYCTSIGGTMGREWCYKDGTKRTELEDL